MNRWRKKEAKTIYKTRALNTAERMKIFTDIDKQYIIEDLKIYAKNRELIAMKSMDLVDWDMIHSLYMNNSSMEYSQFDNMEYAIRTYLDYHKSHLFDKDLYEVEIEETYTTSVEILARNRLEAEALVKEQYDEGTFFEELSNCCTTNFFVSRVDKKRNSFGNPKAIA